MLIESNLVLSNLNLIYLSLSPDPCIYPQLYLLFLPKRSVPSCSDLAATTHRAALAQAISPPFCFFWEIMFFYSFKLNIFKNNVATF